jgi:hypothetical protein
MDTYLPDIMEGVVARVDDVLSSRNIDPFHVFFDKGNYSQVSKNVYSDDGKNNFPLVWLIMPFTEDIDNDLRTFADVTFDVSIAMPTETKFTQQDRDDQVFKPRLLPVYDEVINQLKAEPRFEMIWVERVKHTRLIRPYWGGGFINGQDTKNLFDRYVDEVYMRNIRLKINNIIGPTAFTNM